VGGTTSALDGTRPKSVVATIVIFGASGDLTQRKLIPAIHSLLAQKLLERVLIVGVSRSDIGTDAFREHARASIVGFSNTNLDPETWATLASRIHYHAVAYEDRGDFERLKGTLDELEAQHNVHGTRLFYLSTPPSVFEPILRNLGAAGLLRTDREPYPRVIIEKPFGVDLESARALNRSVLEVLEERQIFRIDHYLGKETVQNLLVFRLANGIFEPLWNYKYVDHVQITGAETLGVERRGAYFDNAGILRDMVQNHLLQVLCLAAMEPPGAFDANSVRDEKLKVLRALRPIVGDEVHDRVVRGQYARSTDPEHMVAAYREESGISPSSSTETYVAMKIFVDNWRWAGVPFYLRSAKRMPRKVTEIAIHFKAAPHHLFGAKEVGGMERNVLAIQIQPDEGITLSLDAKVPGPSMRIRPVTMDFRYANSFEGTTPEAYERLILDAMLGDSTLFTRGDEVEASWSFITPIHQAWLENRSPLFFYPAGSWGPEESRRLFDPKQKWRCPL
jgi:glucose-6-phosphate 1-dehydrogenase